MSRRKTTPTRTLAATLFVPLLLALLAGCGREPEDANAQRYDLKGTVVSVEKERRRLVVEHEEIPGFMEAMTMPFTLKASDADAFNVVAAGDRIQATLVVTDRGYWLENPVITKGGGEPSSGASDAAEPPPGAEVPDFSLVNQDARPVSLSRYKGRALLVTFVYTRCPLPEYCTLMSTNFAETDRALSKEPELYRRTHLLSVTIDPARDTPEVLKSYGAAHTGRYTDERFEHWEFATGKPEEIRRMAEFFGLSYFEATDQIVHSLRTALITPDGRVHKIYRGNEWRPDEVVRDLRELLGQG
ncbi:MAG TPA: SCO family protein [Pyrinomonadaceae bacterium]|nr:SCO family protein [Pyrinomonadaceae bacterium]